MAKCSNCGLSILFGGQTLDGLKYCSADCAREGPLVVAGKQIPEGSLLMYASKIHGGACPCCGSRGPVDVHVSHKIWSFAIVSRWRALPRVSCRSCGLKDQLGNFVFSLMAGWWAVPWGIVLTPLMLVRNLAGMLNPPRAERPSQALLDHSRRVLARNPQLLSP